MIKNGVMTVLMLIIPCGAREKEMIAKQIFHITTKGKVWQTVERMWILI